MKSQTSITTTSMNTRNDRKIQKASEAAKRKRLRMVALQLAFVRLRRLLPPSNLPKESMSEVEILQATRRYIILLNEMLRN